MRRVDPLPRLLASRKRLAISQTSAWAVGIIVERCHQPDITGERNGVRCSSQKLIHCTSFVPFKVRVADVTNAVERNDLRDRFGHERELLPPARVKDHRLIVNDEVLADI